MNKYLLALCMAFCVGTSAFSQAYDYFILKASVVDAYGNPSFFPQHPNTIWVNGTDSSLSNPLSYRTGISFYSSTITGDTVWVPVNRKDDSITIGYYICTLGNPEYRLDTLFVPGGIIDLGTVSTGCGNYCYANFTHNTNGSGGVNFQSTGTGSAQLYRWDFGDGKDSVLRNNNLIHNYRANGTYNVKLVILDTISGCTDSITRSVYVSGVVICGASFTYYTGVNQYAGFTNTSTYIPGSLFTWYFGDGQTSNMYNPWHLYANPGTYTVSLVQETGSCRDSIAMQVVIPPTPCSAEFYFGQQNDSVIFYKNYQGFSGKWDFGDGDTSTAATPVHKFAGRDTTYLVTLIAYDSNGYPCDTFIRDVTLLCNGYLNPTYLSGRVLFDDTVRTGFGGIRFYLISYDSVAGILTAVDSMDAYSNPNDSIYYSFNICNPGRYLVKAALLNGSPLYNDFIPTYSYDALLWSQANSIFLPANSSQYTTINMVRGINPGGPGFIGGYVNMGANKNGEGLVGILVLLMDEHNNPVTYTYSTAGGRYEIPDIPMGKFKVRIEIPGKPSAEHSVTLTTAQPAADDNNFDVNKKDISLSIRTALFLQSQVKLYPNPTAGQLHLEVDLKTAAGVTIKIYDITGKVLENKPVTFTEGKNVLELDTRHLPDGLYFLSLESKEGSYTSRFIQVR